MSLHAIFTISSVFVAREHNMSFKIGIVGNLESTIQTQIFHLNHQLPNNIERHTEVVHENMVT